MSLIRKYLSRQQSTEIEGMVEGGESKGKSLQKPSRKPVSGAE